MGTKIIFWENSTGADKNEGETVLNVNFNQYLH